MEEAYIVYILSAHRERERERGGGGGYRLQIYNKCSELGCWNLKKGQGLFDQGYQINNCGFKCCYGEHARDASAGP